MDKYEYLAFHRFQYYTARQILLMRHTDSVAEVQNTLRQLTGYKLGEIKVVSLK